MVSIQKVYPPSFCETTVIDDFKDYTSFPFGMIEAVEGKGGDSLGLFPGFVLMTSSWAAPLLAAIWCMRRDIITEVFDE